MLLWLSCFGSRNKDHFHTHVPCNLSENIPELVFLFTSLSSFCWRTLKKDKRHILSPAAKGRGLHSSLTLKLGSLLVNLEAFRGEGCPPVPFPFFWFNVFPGKTAEYLTSSHCSPFSWRSLNNYFHWQIFCFKTLWRRSLGPTKFIAAL